MLNIPLPHHDDHTPAPEQPREHRQSPGLPGVQGPITGTRGVPGMQRVVLAELARDAAKQKDFLQIPSVRARELL